MYRFHVRVVLLAAMLLCATAGLRADDDLLTRLVDEHTYDLKGEGESIGGSGLGFLLDATKDAQFFCFSEPHNVRQVPSIFTMLFEALQEQHGFHYAALETGPLIMELASRNSRRLSSSSMMALYRFSLRACESAAVADMRARLADACGMTRSEAA